MLPLQIRFALNLDGVPKDVLDRESAILADKNKGKPENIMEKIIAGGLKSYAKETLLCLTRHSFTTHPKTVTQALKEAGDDLAIKGFVRFALGERHREKGR